MPSLVKYLKSRLSKRLQRIRARFRKAPVEPSPGMGADTHTPIPSVGSPPLPGVPPLAIQVEASNLTLRPASMGPHTRNPAIPILCRLATESGLDELAGWVFRVAFGITGAVIGGAIGRAVSPIGIIVGATLGGVVGGVLGGPAYTKFKRWLFTEGEDGARPIDRIADELRAAGDILMTAEEISAVIASVLRMEGFCGFRDTGI